MSAPENPSAFPLPDHYSHDGMPLSEGSSGMTLRDYFAGRVLGGLLASEAGIDPYWAEWAAERSYLLADAMLAERAKGTQA